MNKEWITKLITDIIIKHLDDAKKCKNRFDSIHFLASKCGDMSDRTMMRYLIRAGLLDSLPKSNCGRSKTAMLDQVWLEFAVGNVSGGNRTNAIKHIVQLFKQHSGIDVHCTTMRRCLSDAGLINKLPRSKCGRKSVTPTT